MRETDKPKLIALLTILGEAFRQSVSEVTLQAYWMGLADLPADLLGKAVQRAIRQCKFFPSVAELRQFSRELRPLLPQILDAGPFRAPQFLSKDERTNVLAWIQDCRAAIRAAAAGVK